MVVHAGSYLSVIWAAFVTPFEPILVPAHLASRNHHFVLERLSPAITEEAKGWIRLWYSQNRAIERRDRGWDEGEKVLRRMRPIHMATATGVMP